MKFYHQCLLQNTDQHDHQYPSLGYPREGQLNDIKTIVIITQPLLIEI